MKSIIGAAALGVALAMPHLPVANAAVPYAQKLQKNTNAITKQQAEAIALQAVGGGTVISCIFENEDHSLHWSVEIVGTQHDYEVWVSSGGKVLRIIQQPHGD